MGCLRHFAGYANDYAARVGPFDASEGRTSNGSTMGGLI